jgi:hypothetical protein
LNEAAPSNNVNDMTIKLIPINAPIIWTLADVQEAMQFGEDLYQQRVQAAREMLVKREQDIPGYVAYAPDERRLLFGDDPPPAVRLGGCGVEVSTTHRPK